MAYRLLLSLACTGALLLCGPAPLLHAQLNATLVGQIDYDERVNDVWGYVAPDGTEYAILGIQNGVAFISLADPANPTQVAFLRGQRSNWRDMKTYRNFAYATVDNASEGLVAYDLSDLANGNVTEYKNTYLIPYNGRDRRYDQAHNLYIDTTAGLIYTAGGVTDGFGGVYVFDPKTDPTRPAFVTKATDTYAHDVYVRGDRIYASQIYRPARMEIYDARDLENITSVGFAPTPSAFTHNAWTTGDGNYVFTTDEKPNAPVAAYDIRDEANPELTFEFRPLASLNRGVIPHNVHVIDEYLSISYYTDGLRVADASVPDNIIEVANYDTWLGADGGFNGNWGAYPFLPSGLTLVSDRDNGLFVVDVDYKRAARLHGTVTDSLTGAPVNEATVTIVADQLAFNTTDASGTYKTGLADAGTYSVTYRAPGYEPKTVTATLSNGQITVRDVELVKRRLVDLSLTVVDATNGEPLSGASVVLLAADDERGGRTDASGTLRLTDVPVNDFELRLAEWGYRSYSETNVDLDALSGRRFELTPGIMDDFFSDEGWRVLDRADAGNWERGTPTATVFEGENYQPGNDAPGDIGEEAYVTGLAASSPGSDDVDNGTTTLISPDFDLRGRTSVTIGYDYFFANGGGATTPNDALEVYLSNGRDEFLLGRYDTNTAGWRRDSVTVTDSMIAFERLMSVRAITSDDDDTPHVAEAGFDRFYVRENTVISSVATTFGTATEATVFPNPSRDRFTLRYALPHGLRATALRVTDVAGRRVLRQPLAGGRDRGTASFGAALPAGTYFVELLATGGRRVYATKVVKR